MTRRAATSGLLLLLAVSLLMGQIASGSPATSRRSLRGFSQTSTTTQQKPELAVPLLTLSSAYTLGGAPALRAAGSSGELLPQELPHRMLASCVDYYTQCVSWAKSGFCAPGWTLNGASIHDVVCTASCGTCTSSTSPPPSPPPLKSPPPSPPASTAPPSSSGAGLSQTNVYRIKHHAPSVVWDSTVELHAQTWANTLASTCTFAHGGHDGEGQNLYASGGYKATWTQIIDAWYNEVSNYKFTATPWTDNGGNFGAIGHFSQLVWLGTSRLGCAMATNMGCASGLQYYYVCNYAAPGNYIGDSSFYANVLPA